MDLDLTHPEVSCRLRNIAIFFLIQVGLGTIIFGTTVIVTAGYYYYFSVLILISLVSTMIVTVIAHLGYVSIEGKTSDVAEEMKNDES